MLLLTRTVFCPSSKPDPQIERKTDEFQRSEDSKEQGLQQLLMSKRQECKKIIINVRNQVPTY